MLLGNEIERLKLVTMEDGTAAPSESYDRTSYNLRLGGEYVLIGGGKQRADALLDCSKGVGVLRLPPFACALVSTEEVVNLPADIYGRWGLKIRPSMSGLIFQAGPQIEPGSNGRLFGLLFNLSSSDRVIHYCEPMWSIDFERLPVPAQTATGPIQPMLRIADYTQKGMPSGSLNEIYADYRALQKENSSKREIGIVLIFSIIALAAGTLLPVVVTTLATNGPSSSELQRQVTELKTQLDDLERQSDATTPSTTAPAEIGTRTESP